MERVVLIKYAEIGLKGKNRRDFENVLIENIKRVTGWEIVWRWGRLFAKVDWEEEDVSALSKTFGVQNYSPTYLTELNLEEMIEASLKLTEKEMEKGAKTFKVYARRAQTKFPFGVYEINRKVGGAILKRFSPDLKVDVHEPDFTVWIEVKENEAYVYTEKIKGPGGLPVGVSGKAILLLSGGIDSPVAGWYAMKRGVVIVPLSFISPPYTGKETKEKLLDIAKVLKSYIGGRSVQLHLCPLTPVLELLKDEAPKKLLLVLQRRSMMRIAKRLAEKVRASAVYTGESVGQVASQTLHNLGVIEKAIDLPVIRPLSGMDKVEIVDRAKEIGTYDISIRPQPDVCSIFTPKSPSTKASLEKVLEVEEELGERLMKAEEEAFASIEKVVI